jgi:predicted PurR-regulated permease PerM
MCWNSPSFRPREGGILLPRMIDRGSVAYCSWRCTQRAYAIPHVHRRAADLSYRQMTDPPLDSQLVSSPTQQRALGLFAIAAAASIVLLSLPVVSGLFLGTLLAFSLQHAHRQLSVRFKPSLAALVLALSSGLATVGGLLLLAYFVVGRGIRVASRVASSFEPEGTWRQALTRLTDASRHSIVGPIDVVERVRSMAGQAATRLTGAVATVAGATVTVLLALFFTTMTTFFVLRNWTELISRAERMLPLHPLHTRVVLAEFQKVGKEVFVGTMLTGVVQGLLAGIGYVLGHTPEPVLLAVLTAICSLIPAVGTLIVWVPVGVGLLATGHTAAGIFELGWGALIVVGASDYVIRPRLVRGDGQVPALITFIALFGGVEVFGLLGLIVGPVIATVAFAVLRTYDREVCAPLANPLARPLDELLPHLGDEYESGE